MRIKKQYSNAVPNGKILNMSSTSQTDTYSCKKIEDKFDEEVGNLSNLATTDKSNVVGAINEVNDKIVINEKGRIQVNTMTGETNLMKKSITFTKQYVNPPIVITTLGTSSPNSYYANIDTYTRSNTNTGCELCANVNITADDNAWLDYIVISMD